MTRETATQQSSGPTVKRVVFPIYNLSCGDDGPQIIEHVVLQVDGVRNAYLNLATEMIYVEFDPCRCTLDALSEAVKRCGYHAGDPIFR